MIEINIRATSGGRYAEVIVKCGNTEINLGLLDERERRELAVILSRAASELMKFEE